MIISKTPFRISFLGGGSDYPEWYMKNGGQVFSTTIDKYCYISIRKLPPFFPHKHRIVYSKVETVKKIDQIQHPVVREILRDQGYSKIGLEIHHDGDLPARAGLGSSSSFTVGLINSICALKKEKASKEFLAKYAIELEQNILKENVGSQDQIAAAYGGLNKIKFGSSGKYEVIPISVSEDKKELFNSHLMLFFTGITRYASQIVSEQMKNLPKNTKSIEYIQSLVDEGVSILENSENILDFGKLLHEAWQHKKSLSSKISTSAIDDHYIAALNAGAVGGKLLGAGGGGFLLLFVEPELQKKVKEALSKMIFVPFKFEREGSIISLYE